jgi:hypothetical protein
MHRRTPLLPTLLLLGCIVACGKGGSGKSDSTQASRRSDTSAIGTVAPATDRAAEASFTGSWGWGNEHEGFDLTLRQEGTKLTGHHVSTVMDGDRTDAVTEDDPPSITGSVAGNVATVEFRSGYSDIKGKARITLRGDSLDWEILSVEEGEQYLPAKATLHRVSGVAPNRSDAAESPMRKRLVGVWQDAPGMAAGWSNAYQFFDDGRFTFNTSQMNMKERERSRSGTWKLDGGKLLLETTERMVIEGGAPANDGSEFSDEIVGGKEVTKKIAPAKAESLELTPMADDPETKRARVRIGQTEYWKFEDDPASYP